jgi:hypothetical protein
MIGRGLERDVKRDLEAAALRRAMKAVEVVERAELRVHRGVATCAAADRPRTADVVGTGGRRIIRALAIRGADRMDRREIDDVEAELGDVVEPAFRVRERAVLAVGAGRAREQLVPRRAPRERALHEQLALRVHRCQRPIRKLRHRLGELRARGVSDTLLDGRGSAQRPCRRREGRATRDRRVDEHRAFEELDRDIDARGELALESALPARERVDPRERAVVVAAELRQRYRRAPRIVARVGERDLPVRGLALVAYQQHGRDRVVTVREQIRLDLEGLANDALDRIATTVDLGTEREHHHAPAPICECGIRGRDRPREYGCRHRLRLSKI